MTVGSTVVGDPAERLARQRARTSEIRERARHLLAGGATGIQGAAAISEATDAFVVDLLSQSLAVASTPQRELLERHSAVVAVGGSGRGDRAPFSDVDLLFLYEGPAREPFTRCTGQVVRDCWDSGIKLGHSIRTIADAIGMARHEPEFATSLVEARYLWGSRPLVDRLQRRFFSRVVRARRRAFIEDCINARTVEREQHGAAVGQLEPDLKRSLGGLRDLHLIRWVGFAHYATADIETLRRKGALSRDDFRLLLAAWEFLTKLRIEMHLAAGKPNDLLSREEQLQIAARREIAAAPGQSSVERFMQSYFQHSSTIANIAERFVALHRLPTFGSRLTRFLLTHRINRNLRICGNTMDVAPRHREAVCHNVERMLGVWRSAALYNATLVPGLIEQFKLAVPQLPNETLPEAGRIFRDLLGRPGTLGPVLRGMYATGLLERLLPEMSHARCLLQFNQYHSFTVDEHTLRAVEAAAAFSDDRGPVGAAYRAIHHKELLHLALLLHDLGKGFDEDHSDVGRRIAEDVAQRLQLPEHQRDQLVFLVHKHLQMAHLAFRRDISDPETLVQFSREVGTPDTLRMLYVLTAADLSAVGPGIWTDWKAELLSELFDRVMLLLSGNHYSFLEEQRVAAVKRHVRSTILPAQPACRSGNGAADDRAAADWFDKQLNAFSPHYLTATPTQRIADDLQIIRRLERGEIVVEGRYDAETGTVDFRVVADETCAEGCFHRIAGVLTAKRLEILSAQICTALNGTVVDSFRVVDNDHAGEIPQFRIDEIADAIRKVLAGETTVQDLFQRHKRFGRKLQPATVSNLPMRVVIDNESSDRSTIIDVFAHDRRGLLYTISRTVFELGLSVVLAKIATHLDQIVDVFYVTDSAGRKIEDGTRLAAIRRELESRITDFEREGYQQFVS